MPNVERNIIIEDARLMFRNFSGKEGQYNRAGDRNFCVVIPPEMIEGIEREEWPIRWLEPRDEDADRIPIMQVKVGYKGRPPRVVLISSSGKRSLDEDGINVLDWAEINKVDVMIRPYNWEIIDKKSGTAKTGVKPYLKSIYVTIEEDELERKYMDVPDSAQSAAVVFDNDPDDPPWEK